MRELIHENGLWNYTESACSLDENTECELRTYPQNLFLLSVKDVCCEGSVSSEPLSAYCFPEPAVMFCHVSHMVTLRVHDNISICLLKAKEQVHHLNLSLYDKPRVRQELRGRMMRPNDRSFIFGDMHRGK
jgi:hypothetical protein